MKKIGNHKFARFLLFLFLIVSVNNILASDLPQETIEKVRKYSHRIAELKREVADVENKYALALTCAQQAPNYGDHRARLTALSATASQLMHEIRDLQNQIKTLCNP